VLKFADEIIQNGYPYGVMEIDDRWQVYYGDLEFDPQRFPDPKAMIDELHAKGIQGYNLGNSIFG
jgi:alpha-glucosidase (family GH31 glycosyl hydrolase)